jgi:ABC-type transport system involved in multi-copper enzyme maturation permease subunit
LYILFLVVTSRYFEASEFAPTSLGAGREMLEALVSMQVWGIVVFLPAMMAGTLAYERERNSMALLLLTDMRPWEILWQKYLSRLTPVFSFLVLSLPLLGLSYAFGGVTEVRLASAIVALLLLCFELGAISLFCSALSVTSAGALVSSYTLAAIVFLLFPTLLNLLSGEGSDKGFGFCYVATYVFSGPTRQTFGTVAARSVLPLLTTALFLGMARVYLVRRALATPRHPILAFVKRIQNGVERMNRALGGVRFRRARSRVPDDHPVAWLELARRLLGQRVFVYSIAVALLAPIVLIACVASPGSVRPGMPSSGSDAPPSAWRSTGSSRRSR